MTTAAPRRNANGDAAMRPWRMGTSSGTRPVAAASTTAIGSRAAGHRLPGGMTLARDALAERSAALDPLTERRAHRDQATEAAPSVEDSTASRSSPSF